MTTYYIIDTRDNQIVNACESDRPPLLSDYTGSQFLRVDPDPPLSMLRRYRYWDERP